MKEIRERASIAAAVFTENRAEHWHRIRQLKLGIVKHVLRGKKGGGKKKKRDNASCYSPTETKVDRLDGKHQRRAEESRGSTTGRRNREVWHRNGNQKEIVALHTSRDEIQLETGCVKVVLPALQNKMQIYEVYCEETPIKDI